MMELVEEFEKKQLKIKSEEEFNSHKYKILKKRVCKY